MKHNILSTRSVLKILLEHLTQHGLTAPFFNDRNFHATFYCEKMLAFVVKRNGYIVEILEESQDGELRSAVLLLQPGSRRLRLVSDWNEVAIASREFGDQSL